MGLPASPPRRVVQIALILAVFYALSQIAVLAAIYWGDEYAVPSWNEHSVPPPRTD